ncbi:MAG TPA: 30S ribosomal protein S5 [Verrucomicrobiae bacterium]
MADQNEPQAGAAPESTPETGGAPAQSGGATPPSGGGGGGTPAASFGGERGERGDRRGGFGGRGGGGRGPRRQRDDFGDKEGSDLTEKVVFINRSSKVVKGGRRFSFSALVVVGDKKGKVGIGLGKAGEVADAIRKGGEDAKQRMIPISLVNTTIPHEVLSEFGGARVLLRPASPGTGIIAGKTVRDVVESVGVKDILSKSLGSKNAANVAKATLKALQGLRLREEIYKGRGLTLRPAKVKADGAAAPAATQS